MPDHTASTITQLFTRLANPGTVGRTEAAIQADIRMLLLQPQLNLDEPALEEPVGDGTRRRIDIAAGATVVEVKKTLTNESAIADHVDQLSGYVHTRMKQTGSRYNGILSDGLNWWLYEADPIDGQLRRLSAFQLAADRGGDLVGWLQAVLATPAGVKPAGHTIEQYLGANSPAHKQDIAYLAGLYRTVADDPTVKLKRELWARLLRSAFGTGFNDQEDLFLAHTLLVLEASAIGHAVMGAPLADVAADPARLLRGDVFDSAGIHNVIESDFFDWVLSAQDGARFVARLVRRIAVFDWSNTDHDVLKVLYESVIRADTRKHLGEYYTPDWLAEGIVEKAVTGPLTQKVLDPACGSGTFVFHTVRRIIAAAEQQGWDNTRLLDHLQSHVFGLDIHPVSVVLARITFLLALGDRLTRERNDVWVPIHLGDSVQWHQPPGHDEDTIRIDTDGVDMTADSPQHSLFGVAKTLVFPLAHVDDPGTFDQLVNDMTDTAKRHTDAAQPIPPVKPILKRFGIPPGNDTEILTETFTLLCHLNAEGRDSIWGYFVRNQVRPLWLSMPGRRVDVLVGNPPWLSYRYMTGEMQKRFKTLSEGRNLWHGAKVATHQDLVGLFIVRAAEKYLDNDGTFAFVTPLAALSRQQYEGFRGGKWGEHLRGEITELWDLDKVRPNHFFPVPAGVVFGTRHTEVTMHVDDAPVPYGSPTHKTVLSGRWNVSGWAATRPALTFIQTENRELGGDDSFASPYRANVTNGATLYPRSLTFVVPEASTNKLGQSAGRTAVRSFRTGQEKPPWKTLPDLTGVIENRFLFDVHLGSTILPFRPLQPWRAVLPIEKNRLLDEGAIVGHSPGLGQWWESASTTWETHKTDTNKLSLLENLDYQSKLAKQLGGSRHRVVYTASGNTIAAARLDDPTLVIEHALYWLPARNITEARYLTAILNAPHTTTQAAEYQSRGLFGARHFDTYVWRLPIPTFVPGDELHEHIAALGEQAEGIAAATDIGEWGFQKARKIVRTALDKAGINTQLDAAVTRLFGAG